MAAAVYRRLVLTQLGGALRVNKLTDNNFFRSSICLSHLNPPYNRSEFRTIQDLVKTNGKRAFHVDTLALVRRLEAQGVPSKQAETITGAITEVLNDSLENVAQSFVSKGQMQKSEMIQDANLSKFISEANSSQEHNFSLLQCERDKLRGDIYKMRTVIDSLSAKFKVESGKLDREIHILRAKFEVESINQRAKTSILSKRLEKEIEASNAKHKASESDVLAIVRAIKYDFIKYFVGSCVSMGVVFAIICFLK
ncbi:uncharacterized protein [Aristolochia californica]|uniref:uncharacterized protein n=1 Tax=Aristolochia californica TaxID=171875 RepID=UPI0035D64533